MSLRCETPCDYGECPYDAMYNHDCEYWCGADEPQDNPSDLYDEEDETEIIRTYDLERDGEIVTLIFERSTYKANNRLSITLLNAEDWEDYADVTKNIIDIPLSNPNCAFLNCNDEPWLEEWLISLGVAKPTGHVAGRYYPEYEFDAEFLEKSCVKWGD